MFQVQAEQAQLRSAQREAHNQRGKLNGLEGQYTQVRLSSLYTSEADLSLLLRSNGAVQHVRTACGLELSVCTATMLCAASCDHLCVCPHHVQDSQRRDRLQAQREQHARLVQDRDRAVRRAGVDLGIQIAGVAA